MNTIVLDKITKFSLFLAAALIPIWVLPFTQNVLAYQKQALFVFLMFAGAMAWLAKAMKENELHVRISVIHIGVLALLGLMALSTIFSLWQYGSFWGWPLDITDSFLTFFAFGLMYFLIVHTVTNARQLGYVLSAVAASGAVAGALAILHLQGVFLPFAFMKSATFNTMGTTNSVAFFAASILPVTLALAAAASKRFAWVLWLVSFALFAEVALINFFDAWVVLVAGLLVLVTFGMWSRAKNTEGEKKQEHSSVPGKGFGWTAVPLGFVVVSVLIMMLKISVPFSPTTPLEVAPGQGAELDIAKKTLQENLWRFPLGSGPGTFVYDYARFHGADVNQGLFWSTRFTSGASEILDWTVTKGVLGLLALLAIIGGMNYLGFRKLIQGKGDDWILGLGIGASFLGVSLGMFLYTSNFVQWFLFWMLLASFTLFVAARSRTISFSSHAVLALGSSFVFLLVLIFGLGLLFLGGQKYAAEVQYLRGAQASSQGDIDTAIDRISSAARMNQSVDMYHRDLAQLFIAKANQVTDDTQQVSRLVQAAVQSAQNAVAVSPNNVANHNVRGFVYRSIIGVPGAKELAAQAYLEAAKLEPASPYSWTEAGRVYVLAGEFEKALEPLQKAVELKTDYSPARFLIASVYEQQGDTERAIAELEQASSGNPSDIGLAFQLGTIYFQREEYGKARGHLERARILNGNYSNARYMLGLVYDRLQEQELAKSEFKKVAELNPDNEEVWKILQNLTEGKPALSGITPSEPPIEEEAPPEEEVSPEIQAIPPGEEIEEGE